ncbi:MAG TPA: GNAT family protein [Polyangia bacterium]|nr:GNAT family protein [Polyangia bacterium]
MIDPQFLPPAPPTLTTLRLRLRALRAEDAVALFDVFADDETMRYWSTPPHSSLAVTAKMVTEIIARNISNAGSEWAITSADSDVAIGKIGHWQWQRTHSRSEIGFILRRDHWRRGLGVEALRAAVGYGFTTLGLNSIEAQLDAANTASARTLERVGFRREGCTRQSYFDGRNYGDTLIYGLLASEFSPVALDA